MSVAGGLGAAYTNILSMGLTMGPTDGKGEGNPFKGSKCPIFA